jgi:hypothetical protein
LKKLTKNTTTKDKNSKTEWKN